MLIPGSSLLHRLFKNAPFTVLSTSPSRTHLSRSQRLVFSNFPSKPTSNSHPFSLKNPGFSSVYHANIPTPVLESPQENSVITLCRPEKCNNLICPVEFSYVGLFSRKVWVDRHYKRLCRWKSTYKRVDQIQKVKQIREITEESLQLEDLCPALIAYFVKRNISDNTLQRNAVMQLSGDQNVIAFTYRHNGVLMRCKYRSLDKKFWKVKGTEKILYGVDDIKEADEIIIVEGEIDKLSMEEAGFLNCVSVPDGAPQKVSAKELPSPAEDSRFQYLWNCKEYLDKASRIILATDGDIPGDALAEELARRLGRERCWRVSWPKKDEFSSFKDANEVLMILGSGALRNVVESAELLDA